MPLSASLLGDELLIMVCPFKNGQTFLHKPRLRSIWQWLSCGIYPEVGSGDILADMAMDEFKVFAHFSRSGIRIVRAQMADQREARVD